MTSTLPDPKAVRSQLARVLAHGLFARSQRMGRFLQLAVERTLDGKAGELKEYLIGVEVFDRKPDYDPRVDPIVRVEARRLRSKLKAYYETDGRHDPVTFEFASGGYAPRICRRSQAGSPAPEGHPRAGPVALAVLPLIDLSAGPGNEYFADGMTEELIHALTKSPGLRVAAWNTALKLSDRRQDIAAIREQLKIDTVLTGSVRISGAGLRVRAQLVDAETGVYLWSETFDRRMRDVFAIQEEIAGAIVRVLRVQLSGERDAAPPARERGSVESYDCYLKGRYQWHQRTPESLAESVRSFQAALAHDPRSALAHAGLADAYSLLVEYGFLRPKEGMTKAKAAASRAAELDPELAEAFVSLALIRSHYDHDWPEAGRLYRRAIELNPGCVTAHHWRGVDYYALLGRFDEAFAELEIGGQLDPLSSIIREGVALVHILKRQYDDALAILRGLSESDPAYYKAYTAMGRVYAQQGRYTEALAMLEKGRALAGDVPNILSAIGQVHGLAGERELARESIAKLERLARSRYIPSTCFAIVSLGLGEIERSLDWLERGCEQGDMPLMGLKMHPLFDPLRSEPRFQALLRRLRFE